MTKYKLLTWMSDRLQAVTIEAESCIVCGDGSIVFYDKDNKAIAGFSEWKHFVLDESVEEGSADNG